MLERADIDILLCVGAGRYRHFVVLERADIDILLCVGAGRYRHFVVCWSGQI